MALIKCHECGNDVSTTAKLCPACGAKVKPPKQSMSRAAKLGLGILGVSLVAGVALTDKQDKARQQGLTAQTPEQIAAVKQSKSRTQTAILGATQLRNSMKDPTAFELTSMMVHDSGFVCYDYRAKNSFGATMPNSAVLTNGAKLLVRERDSSQFVKAWNANCTKPGASDQTDLAINILKRMS